LADRYGYTVAHYAARVRKLPKGFRRWDLQAPDGVSIAELAAVMGPMPADFDDWAMPLSNGLTMAHWAASLGKLPGDFTGWKIMSGHPSKGRAAAIEPGVPVAHFAATVSVLPRDFPLWGFTDSDGLPVATLAAMFGTLPEDVSDAVLAMPSRPDGNPIAQVVLERDGWGFPPGPCQTGVLRNRALAVWPGDDRCRRQGWAAVVGDRRTWAKGGGSA
jgi:hypothetical protein